MNSLQPSNEDRSQVYQNLLSKQRLILESTKAQEFYLRHRKELLECPMCGAHEEFSHSSSTIEVYNSKGDWITEERFIILYWPYSSESLFSTPSLKNPGKSNPPASTPFYASSLSNSLAPSLCFVTKAAKRPPISPSLFPFSSYHSHSYFYFQRKQNNQIYINFLIYSKKGWSLSLTMESPSSYSNNSQASIQKFLL